MKSLLCVLALILGGAPQLRANDVSGSADHPLITRYPGSMISWYDRQIFEQYRIAMGPVTGYKRIDKWLEVEGRITRINYSLEGERSFYEVYANYLRAAEKAGFTILAKGHDKLSSVKGKVGQRGFLGVHYSANAFPPGASLLLTGSASSGGSGYFAARLDRPEGRVYLVFGAAQYSQDKIEALVDIIEMKPLENDLVLIDAEAMAKEIDRSGKVALYGIFFDHDKATLKEESAPALQEIAGLLQAHPKLDLYVVGHTDGSGSLDYNLRLSASRAAAVREALVQKHGIAAERLTPHGVGPLAPVASNREETGRARNRRVELVAR